MRSVPGMQYKEYSMPKTTVYRGLYARMAQGTYNTYIFVAPAWTMGSPPGAYGEDFGNRDLQLTIDKKVAR